MRVLAIVAAMRQELAAILAQARQEGPLRVERVLGRELHTGTLGGLPVLLVQSHVGKVAAAATAALVAPRADAVVMVGTAGGLAPGVRPGDVVIADALLQHDVDLRPLFPRWQADGVVRNPTEAHLTALLTEAADDVVARHRADLASLGITHAARHRGLVVSGDQFVATSAASDALRADLPDALAVEMEGAAIAQVCRDAGVPFALARTVSDRADDGASIDFTRFIERVAAPYARDLVMGLVQRLASRT